MYKETPKTKSTKKSTSRPKKRAPAARRSSRKSARSSDTTVDKEEEGDQSEDEGEWMPWKLVKIHNSARQSEIITFLLRSVQQNKNGNKFL